MNLAVMIMQVSTHSATFISHSARAAKARGIFVEESRQVRHTLFREAMKGKGPMEANDLVPIVGRSNSNTHRSLRQLIKEKQVKRVVERYEWIGD